jgi:hypothetical protein
MQNQSQVLPVEIILRTAIVNDLTREVYTIGGVAVDSPEMVIEVVNMRGDVLRRLSIDDIVGWVEQNHYRYVPRTKGIYHRETRSGTSRAFSVVGS